MSSKLENQYSWNEIGVLFADRIEEARFIDLKEWKRGDFLNWFQEREHIGILFDWKLVARAYTISKSLKEAHDHFTVIIGEEGMGKSTLMIQLAAWISPTLQLGDVTFNMPDYIKKLQEIAKNYKENKEKNKAKSIIIDEGGINLFSRESLSQSNKLLAKTFMVQRFLNVHVGICIPHYWSLDTMIRDHRINTLIVITNRAYYKCFTGQGIKILNKLGKKDKTKPLKAIPIPYGYFWDGKFSKSFPKTISTDKYEEHKFKHIKDFLQEAKGDSNMVRMVQVTQVKNEIGLSNATLINKIKSGKIEGKKISGRWFVSKKAYDEMIMK